MVVKPFPAKTHLEVLAYKNWHNRPRVRLVTGGNDYGPKQVENTNDLYVDPMRAIHIEDLYPEPWDSGNSWWKEGGHDRIREGDREADREGRY